MNVSAEHGTQKEVRARALSAKNFIDEILAISIKREILRKMQ